MPDIAAQTSLSVAGVWKHLKKIIPENTEFHALKANMADQFAKLALDNANLSSRLTQHLISISDDDLGSISPVNLAAIKRTADIGIGIMHDHYRLESGQSTSNAAVIQLDLTKLDHADTDDPTCK